MASRARWRWWAMRLTPFGDDAVAERRAIRVLELRSVRGTGGGPEKTIFRGTARTDPERVRITVCYIRDARDEVFALDGTARQFGVDYVEVRERHSFDRAIWPSLVSLVRERAIDVVHAHEYKTNLLALLLARREGIVPLSTAHGWTGHSFRERALYYPGDRRLLRYFARVIAVSGEIARVLVGSGVPAERVTTILNGIDAEAFRRRPGRARERRASLGFSSNQTVIGGLGRLEPQKRFDLLIDAFAALRASRPGLRLLIAGDGSQRDMLVAHASKRGVTDAVTFCGHRTDVAHVLESIDLFVQASDYEGSPNAVLEAMAMEVPVVATAAGGTAEVIRNNVDGLIVAPGSAAPLTAAMERALTEAPATAARARAARARVESALSFSARMARVDEIYADLMANRHERAAVRA
jgi:glycosyltransferase involved in cell wall biosynthesis